MYNNNNDKVTSFLYSWPAIIIAFFFFWPVGIFLLAKRISNDKTAFMGSSSVALRAAGIVLTVIGVLGLIGFVTSADYDMGGMIVCVFFVVGGVLLLRKSKKLKDDSKDIRKYISVIVNHGVRDIDSISRAMGKTYEQARADVQNLIDKGFLKNAYIDEQIHQVVLASDNVTNNAVSQAQEQARADLRPRVVTCKCCGAINTITGPVGQCEYCDSPIQ